MNQAVLQRYDHGYPYLGWGFSFVTYALILLLAVQFWPKPFPKEEKKVLRMDMRFMQRAVPPPPVVQPTPVVPPPPVVQAPPPPPVKQVAKVEPKPVVKKKPLERVKPKPKPNPAPPEPVQEVVEEIPPLPMTPEPVMQAVAEPVYIPPSPPPVPEVKGSDDGWVAGALRSKLENGKKYPRRAKRMGLEGTVLLRAVLRSDGSLVDAEIKESSGYDLLDSNAMDLLKDSTPLRVAGLQDWETTVVVVPITYRLR